MHDPDVHVHIHMQELSIIIMVSDGRCYCVCEAGNEGMVELFSYSQMDEMIALIKPLPIEEDLQHLIVSHI